MGKGGGWTPLPAKGTTAKQGTAHKTKQQTKTNKQTSKQARMKPPPTHTNQAPIQRDTPLCPTCQDSMTARITTWRHSCGTMALGRVATFWRPLKVVAEKVNVYSSLATKGMQRDLSTRKLGLCHTNSLPEWIGQTKVPVCLPVKWSKPKQFRVQELGKWAKRRLVRLERRLTLHCG